MKSTCCFYLFLVKTHRLTFACAVLGYCLSFCLATIGAAAFFVRSFGCALFILEECEMKKILSLCLVLTLCVSLLTGVTVPASAASGTCGENLTWTLDDFGTLTISGTGEMEDCTVASAPWYSNRRSIKNVVVEDGVTSIGDYAFFEYTSLTEITISDSVTSIGRSAFCRCRSLSSVTIPDSVTSIGDYAFSSCTSLTSVIIGDGVTSIGERVFNECFSLTSVTIGKGVKIIGNHAFSFCESLDTVTIPNAVTRIEEYAFSSCEALRVVRIGNSIKSIGERAFSWC